MIKHVVFDWDETLANTYPVISSAYENIFKTLNMPSISYDEIKRITSTLQNKDTLGYIFGDKKEEAKDAYYKYINEHHISKLEMMPNAEKLLRYCMSKNMKCYLITNKRRKIFLEESDEVGFTQFFTNIVAAGDFEEDKPHPSATRAVFLGKKPDADEILVVGDGVADYKVARTYDDADGKKAKCVIYDPDDKYKGDKPDYKVKDLADIINILEESVNVINLSKDLNC